MYGIFTYIRLMFMVNVGKYTSPMDPLGRVLWFHPISNDRFVFFWWGGPTLDLQDSDWSQMAKRCMDSSDEAPADYSPIN